MVSKRSTCGIEARGASHSVNLTVILEAQAKMQQEFVDYKKRNAEEMEVLREENTRLKKRVEITKGKRVNKSRHAGPRAMINDTEEESEYNHTQSTKRVTNNSIATHNKRRHPFFNGITKTPLPKQWKAPTISYDGTANLDKYLFMYTNHINLYSTYDVILFKAFSLTLQGLTLD